MPPIAPPNPTSPATEPTALCGNKSVGRTITSVDHDCCPKYATLKIASAHETATCGTNSTDGITTALSPSATFRAASTESFRLTRWLENHPPARHPIPDAA